MRTCQEFRARARKIFTRRCAEREAASGGFESLRLITEHVFDDNPGLYGRGFSARETRRRTTLSRTSTTPGPTLMSACPGTPRRIRRVRRLHAKLSRRNAGHECRVVGQHAQLAAGRRHDQELALPRCHQPVGRGYGPGEGGAHALFTFSAFSRASSTVPTYRKACSGRVSHFPSMISRKLFTVSAIFTYRPA